MVKPVLYFILFSIWIDCINSQRKFNVFKSYENADVKPPQYSEKRLRHSIKEYLDPVQKKMLHLRHSVDQPNRMFDANWSGFDLNANKGSALLSNDK